MQFYLAALDEKIKLPDENPSVGLIEKLLGMDE
jgi:hypothetical protein